MNDSMPVGSRWLEAETNRVIVILTREGPDSPWWRYEDGKGDERNYCCMEDFFIWGRFKRLT